MYLPGMTNVLKTQKTFFKQMTDRGVCVSPNVKPGMLLVHPKLKEMQEKGMFVKDSQSEEPGISEPGGAEKACLWISPAKIPERKTGKKC